MDKKVIIIKTPKLKIPKDVSVIIKGPKYIYYLYSKEILNTLEKINEEIFKLRNGKNISKDEYDLHL